MNDTQKKTKKYGKASLVMVMILSAVGAITVWETLRSPSKALAGRTAKPDPLDAGIQRLEMIKQQKATNAQLRKMNSILISGKLKVIPVKDKTKSSSKRKK